MSKKFLYPTLFLVYFAIFYILSFASINGIVFPFATALAFALVFTNGKIFLVVPSFALASLLFEFSIENIVFSAICVLLLLFPFLFHKITKKQTKIYGMILLLALAYLSKIPFIYQSVEQIIYMAVTAVLSVVLFLAFNKILCSVLSKGFVYKFTNLEMVCASCFLITLFCGLSSFKFGDFHFVKLFASFAILFCNYCFKRSTTVIVSNLIAFGTLLQSGNVLFVAPIILWTLSVIIFKSDKRILSACSIVVIESVCGFFLQIYYSFSVVGFLPVVISSFAFLIIPKIWIDKIRVVVEAKNDRLALKNIYNEGKELASRRLEYLSNVFFEMNLVFKAMLKKSLGEEEIKGLLFKETKKRVCENCPEKSRCHRTFCDDTTKSFEEMITIAFKKGKISLLDIPSFLNSRCGKVNLIIPTINSLCGQYKKYSEVMGSLDTSKLLIADQLYGISNIIKNLSKEIAINVSFDTVREEKIKEELCFNNIICSDAIVYDKDIHTKEVSLVVRNEDEGKNLIPQVVSQICDTQMIVSNRNSSITPGWTNLMLKNSPKYDCIFGLSAMTKTGSAFSGDSHSEIRVGDNKFLFAICDGMGSGEKARQTSQISIGLIENFYKAGFDNDTILSSVNKLLLLQREENFSAIDVAVVDLSSGMLDIIKMGSPSGYILSKSEIKTIEGESLPLGIVGESKPSISKFVIDENEFVILMSDGVSDSFASDRAISDYISRLKTTNPQTISDELIQKALANNGGKAIDDMTVLVIKIFNTK